MVEIRHRQKRGTSVERQATPQLSPVDIAARTRALELARDAELVLRALGGRSGRPQPAASHQDLRSRFNDRQWQQLAAVGQRRLEADNALFRALAVMSRPAKSRSGLRSQPAFRLASSYEK